MHEPRHRQRGILFNPGGVKRESSLRSPYAGRKRVSNPGGAFYHPRDYTARPYEGFAPKTEHENDMEGCTITIEKDGSPFGKVVLLETLAHDVFFKYDNRDNRRVSNGSLKLDGAMTFVDGQPAVYIEAEGHGVKAASRTHVASRRTFPGIVYRYTGKASVPESNRDPNATYDLVSIEDTLWANRFDVGSTFCCADDYAMTGGTRRQRSAARSTGRSAAARPNRRGAGTRPTIRLPRATGSAIPCAPTRRSCGSRTSPAPIATTRTWRRPAAARRRCAARARRTRR